MRDSKLTYAVYAIGVDHANEIVDALKKEARHGL